MFVFNKNLDKRYIAFMGKGVGRALERYIARYHLTIETVSNYMVNLSVNAS